MDGCLGGLIWWAFGYAFAYGEGGAAPNKFIGGKEFFLLVDAQTRADESYRSDGTPQFSTWMFQVRGPHTLCDVALLLHLRALADIPLTLRLRS